jgi:site-specific recombinase XerD
MAMLKTPLSRQNNSGKYFSDQEGPMPQRVTTLKTDRKAWTPRELLEMWHHSLQEQDRSAGTVKKYTQAVARFLAWYEQEEHAPLTQEALTPIALIGYRNELQHAQHKSISTINLRISALRAWCGWMTEQGYLAADPAAHVKLVGGEASSERSGLKSAQINALLRQAQESRDKERNYAIVQVLLQTGLRLSECAALTFEDITFGERRGTLRVRAGKGNKARTVPLNASAREALAAYVAPRLEINKPTLKAVASSWPKLKSS